MHKRILSLLLVLTLLLGTIVPAASAADDPKPELTGWMEITGYEKQSTREPVRYNPADFEPDVVFNKMYAMKEQYPEGMRYTNEDSYVFQGLVDGYIRYTGYGCAAFAFMLSDVVFGTLPAKRLYTFTYDDVRAGDILRINGDTHSVIILRKYADHVMLAEANYNSSVHWGRTLTKAQVLKADYVMTRYPDKLFQGAQELQYNRLKEGNTGEHVLLRFKADQTSWKLQMRLSEYCDCYVFDENGTLMEQFNGWDDGVIGVQSSSDYIPGKTYYLKIVVGYGSSKYSLLLTNPSEPDLPTGFMDVRDGAFYAQSVTWALGRGITAGVDDWHFGSDQGCTRGQVVTFLYRAAGPGGHLPVSRSRQPGRCFDKHPLPGREGQRLLCQSSGLGRIGGHHRWHLGDDLLPCADLHESGNRHIPLPLQQSG